MRSIKKIVIFSFATFIMLFAGAKFHRLIAQNSLQLGSFTPLAVPPTVINAECVDSYAEEVIQRYTAAGEIDREQEGEKQLLSCDIYRYLRGCRSNSAICTQPCMYIKNEITPEQIAKYPGVKENFDSFYQISSKLFPRYYIYTKGVGRVGLRMGFGLSDEGKKELDTTLSSLSCVELLDQIHEHLDTPLYFYPAQHMSLELTLPDHQSISIDANPSGVVTIKNQQYNSVSYDVPKVRINQPDNGFLAVGNKMELTLETIAFQLQFTSQEKRDFINHWLHVLPKAPYYYIQLFDAPTAQKLANWTVIPKPDTEIRYIFYFKPLVDRPSNVSGSFHLTPISRERFTVVDIGGLIAW